MKKLLILLSMILLMTTMVFATCPADGSTISVNTTLNSSDYCNLPNGVTLDIGVILDGNGATINGTGGSSGQAVYMNNFSTVKNLNIDNHNVGIATLVGDNVLIHNNTIDHSTQIGIYTSNGRDYVTITDNKIDNTGTNSGIYIFQTGGSTSNDITITGNVIDGVSDKSGIHVLASADVLVDGNTISNVDDNGIYMQWSNNYTVSNNFVDSITAYTGMYIRDNSAPYGVSEGSVVVTNEIQNVPIGITVENTIAGNVSGNTIVTNVSGYALNLDGVNDTIFSNNDVKSVFVDADSNNNAFSDSNIDEPVVDEGGSNTYVDVTADYIVYDEYKDIGDTTNLEVNVDLSVAPLLLETANGKIDWDGNVDLSAVSDLDANVQINSNFISVDSATVPTLNESARLTFYDTGYTALAQLNIFKDGVDCGVYCSNEAIVGENVSVDVTGFSNYSLGCVEDWQPEYTACSIYDNQTLTYADANACGTVDDLPVDNNTVVSCNYCTADITASPTVCDAQIYEWNNYETCCAVTGIVTDCAIPYDATCEICGTATISDGGVDWIYGNDCIQVTMKKNYNPVIEVDDYMNTKPFKLIMHGLEERDLDTSNTKQTPFGSLMNFSSTIENGYIEYFNDNVRMGYLIFGDSFKTVMTVNNWTWEYASSDLWLDVLYKFETGQEIIYTNPIVDSVSKPVVTEFSTVGQNEFAHQKLGRGNLITIDPIIFSVYTPAHGISDITGLVIDFGVEFGITAISLIGVLVIIGLFVAGRKYLM